MAVLARWTLHLGLGRLFSGLELARHVVEALEVPILLSECMQAKGEDDCPFRSNCPVRSKWGRVQVAMMREMASISFEDLVKETLGIPLAALVVARHRQVGSDHLGGSIVE